MPHFPDITILLVTYDRAAELTETIEALFEHLVYEGYDDNFSDPSKLRWLVADDHSSGHYISTLKRKSIFKKLDVQFSVTEKRSGWGANVNHALQQVKTDYVLLCEDDQVLRKPLDLNVHAALMETKKEIGMMRLSGIDAHDLVLHSFEADVSAYLPNRMDGYNNGITGRVNYYLIDYGSPGPYVYSNRPHLVHRRFLDFYGHVPEGLPLGETENARNASIRAKMAEPGAPCIGVLSDQMHNWFEHIGVSRQRTAEDVIGDETQVVEQ